MSNSCFCNTTVLNSLLISRFCAQFVCVLDNFSRVCNWGCEMDGRRITATRRPCCGRRVAAKKRPRSGVDGFVNSVKKLQRREICSKRDRSFSMSNAQERFRNIHLQVHSFYPKLIMFTDN